MEELRNRRMALVLIAILVIVGLISFFLIADAASSESNFAGIYSALDEKKTTVTELMAVTAGSSTAISLLPGDAGTPLAEQMADLSGYFLFILTAIFVEKWLVTMSGMLAFKIMIPAACLIVIIAILTSSERIRVIGVKVAIVALAFFLLVPASVLVTKQVDASAQESMQLTIDEAKKEAKAIKDAAENEKDKNALEKLINKVKGGVSAKIKVFEGQLSNITEHIAVLIVTSCVIPIGVILFFFWIIKMVTGIEIRLPSVKPTKRNPLG